MFLEIRSKRGEQLRVTGRVVRTKVVYRIHDAFAEEPVSNAIDERFGEVRMRHDPVCELHPQVGPLFWWNNRAIQESRLHDLFGSGMGDLLAGPRNLQEYRVVHHGSPEIDQVTIEAAMPQN